MKKCILVAGLLCISPIVCAEDIGFTIRLVDANSGEPAHRNHLIIRGVQRTGSQIDGATLFVAHSKTDALGVAQFSVPNTAKPFEIELLNGFDSCPLRRSFPIREILQSGMNAGSTCTKKSSAFEWKLLSARPGELILFTFKRWGAW